MRVWSRLFLASVSFSIHLTVAAVDFERCSALPPEERVRCVETQLDTAELEPEHLRDLDPLVASEPASVLEITVAIEGRLQGTPVFRAALLDLQAEALMALGKFEEAALRAREALDTSSGVRSLDWRSATGAPVWTAAVDDPGERRVKLARALAAIDAREQARALTEAALRSGAGDDARQLWADLSGGEVPGLDAEPAPLLAGPWFPRLPPVSVTLTDGGSVALADLRGNVLILDFWASWCEPCLAELPELGRLYESEKQRGLEVIIVNMGESQSHAERFARDLGLQMPVGVYDAELEDGFDARSLPTVIVADRDGRVHARWDGYREGLEEEIAKLARELLPPATGEDQVPFGELLLGRGLLEVEWSREVAGEIEGLAFANLEGPDASSQLVAVAGRHTLVYDWRGTVVAFADRPLGSGALRRGDLDGDGVDELFSFRSGGNRYSRIDLEEGEHLSWESPEPLLDLALVPPAGESPGTVAITTLKGLFRADAGDAMQAVAGFEDATGLATLLDPDRPRLLVLSPSRGLCRLGPGEPGAAECDAPGAIERLIPGLPGRGVGGVPRGVAGVAGRFLGGAEGEVALITSTGQFVILDAGSGVERFRATLFDPRAIAAGDLDGDGRDEIALAVKGRVVVLKTNLD